MGSGPQESGPPPRYSFCRLANTGWANPLLRQTLPLLGNLPHDEILVDLSAVELLDPFGVTYPAACLERCRNLESVGKILVRPPSRTDVNKYLQDTGVYEAIGLGDQFQARQPKRDRADLVTSTTVRASLRRLAEIM